MLRGPSGNVRSIGAARKHRSTDRPVIWKARCDERCADEPDAGSRSSARSPVPGELAVSTFHVKHRMATKFGSVASTPPAAGQGSAERSEVRLAALSHEDNGPNHSPRSGGRGVGLSESEQPVPVGNRSTSLGEVDVHRQACMALVQGRREVRGCHPRAAFVCCSARGAVRPSAEAPRTRHLH